MTWPELRDQAQAILANTPTGDFEDITFTALRTGMFPIKVEVDIVHQCAEYAYRTQHYGDVMHCSATVRCRRTGARSAGGLEIFESQNGKLFVFRFIGGDAENLDAAAILPPKLAATPVG